MNPTSAPTVPQPNTAHVEVPALSVGSQRSSVVMHGLPQLPHTSNTFETNREVSIPPPPVSQDMTVPTSTEQRMQISHLEQETLLNQGTVAPTIQYSTNAPIPDMNQQAALVPPTVHPNAGAYPIPQQCSFIESTPTIRALYHTTDIKKMEAAFAEAVKCQEAIGACKDLLAQQRAVLVQENEQAVSAKTVQVIDKVLAHLQEATPRKIEDYTGWHNILGIELLLPRIVDSGEEFELAKCMADKVKKTNVHRQILHAVDNALAINEKINLLDFAAWLPEYASRIIPAQDANAPLYMFVDDPEVLEKYQNTGVAGLPTPETNAPVLDTDMGMTAPVIPGEQRGSGPIGQYAQPGKKRQLGNMPINGQGPMKRIKTEQKIPYSVHLPPLVTEDYNPAVLSPAPLLQAPMQHMHSPHLQQPHPHLAMNQPMMSSGKKPKRAKKAPGQKRKRFPADTKKEWGFDADDILAALVREHGLDPNNPGKTEKRGYHWARIAKEIANEYFISLGDPGPKLKAVLRRKYPHVIGHKVKVPANPKQEWGFDAADVKRLIEELYLKENMPIGTPCKNISLSKIGEILGHKTVTMSRNAKYKPFAQRKDRGQLVAALLRNTYPDMANLFRREKNRNR